MGILSRLFGDEMSRMYNAQLDRIAHVTRDIHRRLDIIGDRGTTHIVSASLEASEMTLARLLTAPLPQYNYSDGLTDDGIIRWVTTSSKAILSYVAWSANLSSLSDREKFQWYMVWSKIMGCYTIAYGELMTINDQAEYAEGLIEDTSQGYSVAGKHEKAYELAMNDFRRVGSELLREVWQVETVDDNEAIFVGSCLWDATKYRLQPLVDKGTLVHDIGILPWSLFHALPDSEFVVWAKSQTLASWITWTTSNARPMLISSPIALTDHELSGSSVGAREMIEMAMLLIQAADRMCRLHLEENKAEFFVKWLTAGYCKTIPLVVRDDEAAALLVAQFEKVNPIRQTQYAKYDRVVHVPPMDIAGSLLWEGTKAIASYSFTDGQESHLERVYCAILDALEEIDIKRYFVE